VAHPQLAAFARLANGAQPPARRIYGQNSKLSRTMHDIRYNPVDDEVVVPNPFSNAILIFRGGANGQDAPLRIIQGPNTQLTGPQWLDVDAVNREIFVPGPGSVQVYPLDGNGDVRPKRTIQGPDTQLLDGDSIAVDPLNNLLVVAGRNDKVILVFDRAATGNARPLRVITGPNTDIDRLNQLAVYPEGRLVLAALPSRGVAVWSLDDDGDVAPKWAITGDQTSFKKVRGVALNAKQKEIYVTDTVVNGVLTFSVPEIFESPASGAAPLNRR
jgi:DNA-binding beta-propeller fold protein YncE